MILAFLIPVNVFSKDAKVSLKEPKDGKIIVIGRIKVIYDEDKDFIAKTFSIAECEKSKPDLYERPTPLKENQSKDRLSLPDLYENGDLFFDVCWISKRKISYEGRMAFYFFGKVQSKKEQGIFITLPYNFSFEVPKECDCKAFYIGTFIYHVFCDDYKIKKIEILDEYDEAEKELNKITGKDFALYKAELKY